MYGYVGGNPIQYIDTHGRFAWFIFVPPAIAVGYLAWNMYNAAKACSDVAQTAIDAGEIADHIESQNAMQRQLNMSVDPILEYENPGFRYRNATKPLKTIGRMFSRGSSYVGAGSRKRCKPNSNRNSSISGNLPRHTPYQENSPTYWDGLIR